MGLQACDGLSNRVNISTVRVAGKIVRNEIDTSSTIRVGAGDLIMHGRYVERRVPGGTSSVKPGEGVEPSFQLIMLRALLLPPRCRDVFVLKQIHGYTLTEVAAVLGISTSDVKKHLRRALREMQHG